MTISARDRKLLWARAGNECAFPGCSQSLALDSGPGVIVGEEAHIVARNPGGPRGAHASPPESKDAYSNLILLCPTHHVVVDQQPEVFGVGALLEMKATHERSVLDRIRSDDLAASLLFDIPCMGRITNVWRLGSAVLVCCSYGPKPVEVGTGRWKGNGLRFYFAGTDAIPIQLHDSSEAHADIQYWLEGDALHLELATFLYDEGRFAPFAELVFSVKGNSPRREVIMLMGGSPDQTAQISSILADLKQCDPATDRSVTLVGHLFKIGLGAPAEVLSVFDEACEVAFPGGEGSLGMMMRSEIELVLEATAVD